MALSMVDPDASTVPKAAQHVFIVGSVWHALQATSCSLAHACQSAQKTTTLKTLNADFALIDAGLAKTIELVLVAGHHIYCWVTRASKIVPMALSIPMAVVSPAIQHV